MAQASRLAEENTMNVKALRQKLGFSKSEWARIFNVTERTVYRWDSGADPTGTAYAVLAGIKLALAQGASAIDVYSYLQLGIGPFVHSALIEKSS
jgi:DNA-binding XRE family transcriptional regulator